MTPQFARFDSAVLLVVMISAAFVPLVFTNYEIKLATSIAIQVGLAASLGLLVGSAGLVSMGHAALYGLAAYVLVIMAPSAGPANLLLTATVAILCTAACAAVVGALSIRSRGLYFILMTLAFGQLAYHFFHDTGLVGSADGSYVNFRPELRLPGHTLALEGPVAFYFLTWFLVCVVLVVCWHLRRSAFGTVLIAARDNEERVRAFGFSPYLLRLVAFTTSGAMAGAMGYLTAAQNGFVAPAHLTWHMSATVLVMVLIGGKESVSGPVIGAVFLLLLEEILQRRSEFWLVGVGLIIVGSVLAAPRGLVFLGYKRVVEPVLRRWWPLQQDEYMPHG